MRSFIESLSKWGRSTLFPYRTLHAYIRIGIFQKWPKLNISCLSKPGVCIWTCNLPRTPTENTWQRDLSLHSGIIGIMRCCYAGSGSTIARIYPHRALMLIPVLSPSDYKYMIDSREIKNRFICANREKFFGFAKISFKFRDLTSHTRVSASSLAVDEVTYLHVTNHKYGSCSRSLQLHPYPSP